MYPLNFSIGVNNVFVEYLVLPEINMIGYLAKMSV